MDKEWTKMGHEASGYSIYAQFINSDTLQFAKQLSELIIVGLLVCELLPNNIL